MKQLKVTLIVMLALIGFARPVSAARNYAPIHDYVSSTSVLGTYYAHFVDRYGREFADRETAFQSFCRILRTSDLLAEELIAIGIPTDQINGILAALEGMNFQTESRQTIRQSLLAIDYALESIEASLTRNHRQEFRREVLAQVPPMSYNG